MVRIGEHITLDVIGMKKDYSPSFYEALARRIAKKAEVTVLQVSKHEFEPQGFTMLVLLAESHISVHTFPEHGIASFDFFTCGNVSPSIAIDMIKEEIEHTKVITRELYRSTQEPALLYKDIDSSKGIKKSYAVGSILEDFTSKAGQHIQVLDIQDFGPSLFIDNDLQVATKDEHLYSSTFVQSGLKKNSSKGKAAIIGGGDLGVARECVAQEFESVDLYELDPEVVKVCDKYLSKIGNQVVSNGAVTCAWGDAFENIKTVADNTYDKIFVDLNDDEFCINLTIKNMGELKRILKSGGTITAQVGSKDIRPEQVEKWLATFKEEFGNVNLDEVYIPSFDCHWNFASSIYNQ